MQSFKIIALLLASTACARQLRKFGDFGGNSTSVTKKKANFANVLVGIQRKIKAGLTTQLTTGQPPAFAADIFGCALTIRQGMDDLRFSYTEVNVPTIISQACDFSNVYLELGHNKEQCNKLLAGLEEEWKGEKNYHRWCRKVASSESESMTKALEKIENDPESKKLLAACQKECPFIAKIIASGAAIAEVMMKMWQPPPAGTKFEDLLKMWTDMYKKIGMHGGKICDDHAKMKCTLQDMHGSCRTMFDKVSLPLPTVERLFSSCKDLEPCKKTCNGVTEKMMDFEVKHSLSMFTGGSTAKEMVGLCKSYHRVNECYEKPECKGPLDNLKYTKEEMTKRCEVVDDPCFTKISDKCDKENNEFFGKPGKKWDEMSCTDKFYPWMETSAKDVKKCCGQFGSLSKCAKDLKCEQTLKKFMYITPHPNWPEGDIVQCSCPDVWSKAFGGGKACPKGDPAQYH